MSPWINTIGPREISTSAIAVGLFDMDGYNWVKELYEVPIG